MNEGETEMVVCFDNFGNMSKSINSWRTESTNGKDDLQYSTSADQNDEQKSESSEINSPKLKPSLDFSAQLSADDSEGSMTSPKTPITSPKQTFLADTATASSCADLSQVTLRKRSRTRRKRAHGGSGDKYQFSLPDCEREYPTENLITSPRESMPPRSSVRLFFDPRDTNAIANEAGIDVGSLFQDMVDGKPESVRDKLKLLSPESRFLLIFRLQRAAQNFVVTLDECK